MSNTRARKSINFKLEHEFSKIDGFKRRTKSKFYYLTRDFTNFDNLTKERKDELKHESDMLKEKYLNDDKIGNNYYKILLHISNCISEKIYQSDEAILVLIETIDSSLNLLKFFLRCNDNSNIEVKSNLLLGFYDEQLINYELEYAKKFRKANPNNKVKQLVREQN